MLKLIDGIFANLIVAIGSFIFQLFESSWNNLCALCVFPANFASRCGDTKNTEEAQKTQQDSKMHSGAQNVEECHEGVLQGVLLDLRSGATEAQYKQFGRAHHKKTLRIASSGKALLAMT